MVVFTITKLTIPVPLPGSFPLRVTSFPTAVFLLFVICDWSTFPFSLLLSWLWQFVNALLCGPFHFKKKYNTNENLMFKHIKLIQEAHGYTQLYKFWWKECLCLRTTFISSSPFTWALYQNIGWELDNSCPFL